MLFDNAVVCTEDVYGMADSVYTDLTTTVAAACSDYAQFAQIYLVHYIVFKR